MSVASSISAVMEAAASKREQLHKAFLELQSHSSALMNFTVQWKELEDHFNEREKLLQKRIEELERKEKANEKEKKSAAEKSTVNPKIPSEKKSGAEKSTGSPNKTSPALKEDVKPRLQLKSLCEKMDGEGLKKFLADSRSEVTAIRNEIPAALRCAADPAKLVLKALEGLYPDGNVRTLPASLSADIQACDLLLGSLPSISSLDEMSSEAKRDAKKVAAAWKSKLNVDAESRVTVVEARAFLRLLASYGISKEFKDDDLCELVLRIYSQPKVTELCRALQFSHKIPDVVEKLSSNRKQMDAIRFVYAFGLVDKFPPVPLLKAYLEDEKKFSQELAKRRRNSVGAQNDAASNEIKSLKTVIKFIEEHKLEAQMSSKDLWERVNEVQKANAERKRSAEVIKSQSKRARLSSGDGVVSGAGAVLSKPFPPSASALTNSSALLPEPRYRSASALTNSSALLPETRYPSASALTNSSALLPEPRHPSSSALTNSSDLYRAAPVASIPSYNLPGQGVYDMGNQGVYRSSYDVGSNPSSLSRSHLYPSDSLQSSLYGVGSFRGSTNYGSYNNGSGVPPATSYKSSYLH